MNRKQALPLNCQSQQLSFALSSACYLSHFCKQCGPRSDCSEQSDQGLHCLPVCINRFEKFARIFSRRHKQTTFSDAGFLGSFNPCPAEPGLYPAFANSVGPDQLASEEAI